MIDSQHRRMRHVRDRRKAGLAIRMTANAVQTDKNVVCLLPIGIWKETPGAAINPDIDSHNKALRMERFCWRSIVERVIRLPRN